jgi:hypothetical protein
LDSLALLALQGLRVSVDRAAKVPQGVARVVALRDFKVLLEALVPRVFRVFKVFKVHQELVPLELRALRVGKVLLDQMCTCLLPLGSFT